jgi:signal transduction histidine kinase
MKILQFFVLLLLWPTILFSQSSIPLDTLLVKASKSQDSSQYYFKEALRKVSTKADTGNYFYHRFFINDKVYNTDSTTYYAEKVIPILIELDSLSRLREIYDRLHYQELRAGRYEECLNYIQLALTTAEKMRDTAMISLHYADKAILYHDFEDYEKGIEYGKIAFKIMNEAKKKEYRYLIFANNSIAINFDDWGKGDSALYYHYMNVDYLKHVKDSTRFSFVFNNIGNTLLKQEKFEQARKMILRALTLNKMSKKVYNLATNYTNLATIDYELKNYESAKANFVLANQYARESESIEKIRDVIQQEAWFYKKTGDYKMALEKQEAFYVLRDSIFNKDRAQKVAEMETKYETEKKERDLAETRANLAEKDLEVERKNLFFYGATGIAIIFALLGFLIFKQQRLKNRQLQREAELKEALARIETQNKLQEQRLRISRDLHDNIGSQLTFVTSSLDNLKYKLDGEDSVVSQKLDAISQFTTQTIYELRDTIWAMNKEKINMDDLRVRISNFIDKAGSVRDGITYQFLISEKIDVEDSMPSVQGMNVYRIIQEAINNSLKYSEASNIEVFLDVQQDLYVLEIKDNGKGFHSESVSKGNGLANIEKRTRDLKGESVIESEPGKGTRILITFPKS